MAVDAYYTPPDVALRIASSLETAPRHVLDPSCGTGQLLRAVVRRFHDARVFGIDHDQAVVRSLRVRQPGWVVSNADATSIESLRRTRVARLLTECDVVVMNPPFSMGSQRRVQASVGSLTLSCGVAMKHVMRVCTAFVPETAVAVLPESALFSELDSRAREYIREAYSINILEQLHPDSFGGARVRTYLVKLRRHLQAPAPAPASGASTQDKSGKRTTVVLARGTLPLFRATSGSLPLLHTTNLSSLTRERLVVKSLPRVCALGGGQISGYFALLPRVGNIPSAYRPRLLFSPRRVQLSDCLVAIGFRSQRQGRLFIGEIRRCWESFHSLFRGTGARYTTVERIGTWISENTSFEPVRIPTSRLSSF